MTETLREGPGLAVHRLVVGPLQTNCYLAASAGDCAVVDPGGDAPVILEALRRLHLVPRAFLLTHAHADHTAACALLKEEYPQVPLYLHAAEASWPGHPAMSLSYWLPGGRSCPQADVLLEEGGEIAVGKARFAVLHLPGHTPGSVGYLEEEEGVLFCGDVVFRGSVGRTDLPGSSEEDMRASLERLCRLPGELLLLPGHGPQTTLGEEKRHNPFLAEWAGN